MHQRTCTHCGRDGGVGDCVLRFSADTRDAEDLDLELCEECLEEFLAEPSIELIEPQIVLFDDPTPVSESASATYR